MAKAKKAGRAKVAAKKPIEADHPPLVPLTEKQMKVLLFIYQFYVENDYYPNQYEIAEHFGQFQSQINQVTKAMEKKCWIFKVPKEHRNIRITGRALPKIQSKLSVKANKKLK